MTAEVAQASVDLSSDESTRRELCQSAFLGSVPFREAWDLQVRLGKQRAEGAIPDTLLLLEHPHVYTLGRLGDPANILLPEHELRALGVEVVNIDRGGDVTYHGPGQLVGYPIMLVEDRRDLLKYIRRLEETLIHSLASFGIDAGRIDGLSGVWVGTKKIAAIGVKMGRVTSHGFALNVSTDLSYFEDIIPCGIRDKGVTSMERELAHEAVPSVKEVAGVVAASFGEVFDRTMLLTTPRELSL